MALTDDPNDPRLTHGADSEKVPQAAVYLVLSEEERKKGFVRPVRGAYRHVGRPGPTFPLRDLTDEEKASWNHGDANDYVKFETYPPEHKNGARGKFWTQAQLDEIGKGCGHVTTMARELAETYARQPAFYGATYCAECSMHLPVHEFVWLEMDGTEVNRVGS